MSESAKSPHGKKLFLMMVLEFFIWGAWLPLIWGYMGKDGLAFTDLQITWVGSARAITDTGSRSNGEEEPPVPESGG